MNNYQQQLVKHLRWGLSEYCKHEGCDKIVNNKVQLCKEHRMQACTRCKKLKMKFVNGMCSTCNLKVRGRDAL
jgi:hypothetical protein